jgi:hypothetical protein
MDAFTLNIKLGNAEMQTHADVACELRAVAAQMELQADMDGTIYDGNGNSVGSFRFTGPGPLGAEDSNGVRRDAEGRALPCACAEYGEECGVCA